MHSVARTLPRRREQCIIHYDGHSGCRGSVKTCQVFWENRTSHERVTYIVCVVPKMDVSQQLFGYYVFCAEQTPQNTAAGQKRQRIRPTR
eukprot:13498769-Heterocapsa_arctica.AAC.1